MPAPKPEATDIDLSLPAPGPGDALGAPAVKTVPQPALVREADEVTRIRPSAPAAPAEPAAPLAPATPAVKASLPPPTSASATAATAADVDLDIDLVLNSRFGDETLVRQDLAAAPPDLPAGGEQDTLVRPDLAAPQPVPVANSAGPLAHSSALAAAAAGSPNTTGIGRSLPGKSAGDGPDSALRQVGRYQIRQRLGRGGMASVYRAHDPTIGRDVAIKFLHASLSEDEECRTRFVREARAAGALSHPNIVVVHDVGELEGRPFMAMELLEGQSLAEVLQAQPTLSIRDVLTLGMQLARALEYAHARGIVHRDIKPGNIMLLADKSAMKVTDFGIAHIEDASMQQQTLVGAVLGTPQYMSPEQTRGEKLDGRSDLFSAGIVLYQALTGERPFKGDNMVVVAQQIANSEPPPINTRRPDTPAALRRVVERCLAKQPEQRYASGTEVANALRKVYDELEAAEAEKNKPRILPLRLKWALMMAALVALVMGITTAVISQRQYSALMAQASDYGAALTRFIAAQNAAAVLGEEWEVVDIAVQETMKTRNFERITVIDSAGVVRASTVPGLAGQPYKPAAAQALASLAGGGVSASRYQAAGAPVLGFEAPVMYRDRQVGRVALGVLEGPLSEVARLSITLMVVLALVTVAAVALAMFFVANWFARPIQLVVDSMGELAMGHYGHRIAEKRRDEFGQLFAAFDQLAGALQQREQGGAQATPPPGRSEKP